MPLSAEEKRIRHREACKRSEARKRGEEVAFLPKRPPSAKSVDHQRREGETQADYRRRYQAMVQAERKAWKAANAERIKAYSRVDFEKNREQKIANLKAWVKENPDKHLKCKKAWEAKNPGYKTAAAAKIRAKIIDRTPAWADWRAIWRVYGAAKQLTKVTGIPHEVDHIIPLNGKNVSGLHVHYNLQVIPAVENRAKRNYVKESI